MRRSRGENGALDALHERLGSRGSLHRPLLQVVNFLKLLLNPRVPEVEGNFLLLALRIQLARGHREYKVRVLFIVDNFQGQATQSEVFFFRVFARISFPFLANRTRRVLTRVV